MKCGADAGSLESFCGRAALLAGTIESHAGAGLGLSFDRWMAYDLCKDERCSGNRQVAVLDWCDRRRVSRAPLGFFGEVNSEP